jgi:hypothetical protein
VAASQTTLRIDTWAQLRMDLEIAAGQSYLPAPNVFQVKYQVLHEILGMEEAAKTKRKKEGRKEKRKVFKVPLMSQRRWRRSGRDERVKQTAGCGQMSQPRGEPCLQHFQTRNVELGVLRCI